MATKNAKMAKDKNESQKGADTEGGRPVHSGTKLSLVATLSLVGLNFVYAGTSVFSKMASREEWLSWRWGLWMAGTVGMMGLYALLWQQTLARVPLAVAYMFRGMSLVFVLALSAWLFGEVVTGRNLAGATMIVAGIVLYARA